MRYTEEIFTLLSRGGFISANSVNARVRAYYDAIDDEPEEYANFFSQIGFVLTAGDGFYYFSRRETRVDLERKIEAACRWIDYVSFVKTFDPAFAPGFLFRPADIVVQIGCNMELKEMAKKLFPQADSGKLKTMEEVIGKLVAELERYGVIERENEYDGTYKVLNSFHYMEELIDSITIDNDASDEVS